MRFSQKILITLASVYTFPYRRPKLRLDLQSLMAISLLITISISLNTQKNKFAYRSNLETTILALFSSKSLNYTTIILFLQKLSTLTFAKVTISTRTDITLQTIVKKLRAITMCSAFTPDCGYDKNSIILIGDVYFPNTKCAVKHCLHKKNFSISRQKRLSMPAPRVCVSGAQNFWKIEQIVFCCRLVKGCTFLQRL